MVYKAKGSLYFCGDLHCNFHWLKPFFERTGLKNCTIIFCGDVGLGFQSFSEWSKWLTKLKLRKFLKENKIRCFFVRGNHDDPKWFDGKTVNTPYMKAIPDYSVVSCEGHNVLCVGGAVSLDRSHRLGVMERETEIYIKQHPECTKEQAYKEIRKVYWFDEIPVYNEQAINDLPCKIDIICSHSAPGFFAPVMLDSNYWAATDKKLIRDCLIERKVFENIYSRLIQNQHPVRNWYYGHYHYYNVIETDNVAGHLLDMARAGNLCIKKFEQ